MRNHERGKYGSGERRGLGVVRGGLSRRPAMRLPAAKEIEFNERVRAKFALCLTPDGKRPSRAVQEIVNGIQKPLSIPARRVLEMRRANVRHERARAIAEELVRLVDEVYYLPPAA